MGILKKNTPTPQKAEGKPDVGSNVPAKGVERPRAGRKQLAEIVYDRVKAAGQAVPMAVCETMVVAYEEAVYELLMKGDEVSLSGFGKFVLSTRPEQERRNPKTGEKLIVPAHRTMRFKAGALLRRIPISET